MLGSEHGVRLAEELGRQLPVLVGLGRIAGCEPVSGRHGVAVVLARGSKSPVAPEQLPDSVLVR